MLGAGVAGEGTKKKVKRRGRMVGGSREKKEQKRLEEIKWEESKDDYLSFGKVK